MPPLWEPLFHASRSEHIDIRFPTSCATAPGPLGLFLLIYRHQNHYSHPQRPSLKDSHSSSGERLMPIPIPRPEFLQSFSSLSPSLNPTSMGFCSATNACSTRPPSSLLNRPIAAVIYRQTVCPSTSPKNRIHLRNTYRSTYYPVNYDARSSFKNKQT